MAESESISVLLTKPGRHILISNGMAQQVLPAPAGPAQA